MLTFIEDGHIYRITGSGEGAGWAMEKWSENAPPPDAKA